MGNCKDCEYWDKDPNDIRGDCLKTKADETSDYNIEKHADYDDSMMTVTASAEYGAEVIHKVLMTRQDFGCVQFEAKQA